MPALTQRSNRHVVADVYDELQPLIRQIARRFSRRFHTDFDETLAEANHLFLRAYHSFIPGRSSIEQRVQSRVWNELVHQYRMEHRLRCKFRLIRCPMPHQIAQDAPIPFDRDGLMDSVGRDARIVLGLILNTPKGLSHQIRSERHPNVESIRRQIRRWCLHDLGWTRERYVATFHAIQMVFQS